MYLENNYAMHSSSLNGVNNFDLESYYNGEKVHVQECGVLRAAGGGLVL